LKSDRGHRFQRESSGSRWAAVPRKNEDEDNLSNFLKNIHPMPILKLPIAQPAPPTASNVLGIGVGPGSCLTRLARNELRGYRRWGYPGAFGVPTTLLWTEAALADAEAEDDLAELDAVEEDLWG
jgi:hypothetical protein